MCASGIKVDLSSVHGMDRQMMESILLGPFRAPFKGLAVELILRDVGLSEDHRLEAMSAAVQCAETQRADCNGIQSLDVSDNGLGAKFTVFCSDHISRLFCLESLTLDFNFVGAKKKGAHRGNVEALCVALSKLPLLRRLSLRGDFARTAPSKVTASNVQDAAAAATPSKWLTTEDLMPLLQFLSNTVGDQFGGKRCCLEELCLDGNRLKVMSLCSVSLFAPP